MKTKQKRTKPNQIKTPNSKKKKSLLVDILTYTLVLVSIFIFTLQVFGVYWEFINWGQPQQIHL